MGNSLYGPHLMAGANNHRDLLARWQPSVCLFLHPKPEEIQVVRDMCPGTIIIGRGYADDNLYSNGIYDDPAGSAKIVHDAVMATDWWDKVDFVQTNNEVQQSKDWVDGHPPTQLAQLNAYSLAWMELASPHYACAIGSFSVGNPDVEADSIGDAWPQFYPAMAYAKVHGHILLVHEYGWPDFWHPEGDWHIGRYANRVWPQLPDDVRGLPVVFGEFGYDKLIVGSERGGWQATGLSAQDVSNELTNYHYDLKAWQEAGVPVLGACLYCIDPGGGWESYDFSAGGDGSPISLYVSQF